MGRIGMTATVKEVSRNPPVHSEDVVIGHMLLGRG